VLVAADDGSWAVAAAAVGGPIDGRRQPYRRGCPARQCGSRRRRLPRWFRSSPSSPMRRRATACRRGLTTAGDPPSQQPPSPSRHFPRHCPSGCHSIPRTPHRAGHGISDGPYPPTHKTPEVIAWLAIPAWSCHSQQHCVRMVSYAQVRSRSVNTSMISLLRGRRTVWWLCTGLSPQVCGDGIMNPCQRFMLPPHFQAVAVRFAMKTFCEIFNTLGSHSRTAESDFVLQLLPSCAALKCTR